MFTLPQHRRTSTIETFTTPRLLATRIAGDDFADLCRLHSDPQVMATLGGVRSDATTRQFLAEKIAHWQDHGFGFYIFRNPETGQFAGRGGLQNLEVGGAEEVEIGYTVCADLWNQGYATEMACAMLAIGFEQLGLDNIVSFTNTSNLASRRVMEKLGLTYERDIIHENRPQVLYRITAEQFAHAG